MALLRLLLPLLLLLILASPTSYALDQQTLDVTPLHRSHSPDLSPTWTATADDEEATVGPAGPSLHLRLAHLDSILAAHSSPEDLLRLRLQRDAARVAKIASSVRARPNATRRAGGRGSGSGSGFSSPVVSGLAQGSGEYFTRVGVGTPPVYAYMVLDTGSDVVWLQCAPCRRCYPQSDPVFDPRRSRSFAAVPCSAPLCRALDASGCDVRRRACLYQVSYGDGSVTTGDFSTETLTFPGGSGGRVPRVALGCGHDNEGLFVAAAGLLGLGRGPLSFPSQAGLRFRRRFSYCLIDRTSSSSNSSRSSSVVFGAGAVPRANGSYTPMVRNPRMDTFYYVGLTGVSVGGARVAGVSASDLRLDLATGRGGVIVDSGTSVTRLARPAYEALRDAFRAGAAGLRTSPGGYSLFDTCYDLSGRKEVKVPTVVMHLAGGAAVTLPAENYLIPVDTRGTFCFAFAGTDSGISIIGNIQQQGFRVVFDGGARARVGFVPRAC